jgi:hypothetical protein
MNEKKKDYSQLILAIYKSDMEIINKEALEDLLNLNNNYSNKDIEDLIRASFASNMTGVNKNMIMNVLKKRLDDLEPVIITRKKHKEYLEYERRCLESDRLEKLRA